MSAVTGEQQEPSSIWRWLGPLASLVVFGFVAFVLHREIAHLHVRDIAHHLGSIPRSAVGAALVLTALSYWLLSYYDWLAMRYIRKTMAYSRLLFTSFIAYAFGHNLGLAAFTGAAIRMRLYGSVGLTAIEVVAAQGFCSLTSAIGLTTLGGLALVLAPDKFGHVMHLNFLWARALGAIMLGVIVAYVVCCALIRRNIEIRGWQLRMPRPSLALMQIVVGLVDLNVAATILWILIPPEANVTYVQFIGAYAAAVTAGLISHVPGGIGVFETVIILAIPQVPASELLSAILVYRATYYLVPLVFAALMFGAKELEARRGSL